MQTKLNYYSRYNRIKLEEQKTIPSLYSLLSTQTLNKLAHDASVSLQMISLYNRQNNHSLSEQEGPESEYLQANKNRFNHSLYHSLDEKSHSLSPSVKEFRQSKISSSLVKRQRISKKMYLQNLVKEVRQNSLQRVKNVNQTSRQDVKKRKHTKSKKSKIILNDLASYVLKDNQKSSSKEKTPSNKVNEPEKQKNDVEKDMIQNKLIQSLLSQSEKHKKQIIVQKSQPLKYDVDQGQNFNKEYVQSVEDENEENSKPSIVIQRFNLINQKNALEQPKKDQNEQSKEDNPSSKDQKESEIKSFSKESVKNHKPTKNLIELELTHSQSEIWNPQQRSLDVPPGQSPVQQNLQTSNILVDTAKDHLIGDATSIQYFKQEEIAISEHLSNLSKDEELQEEMNDVISHPLEQIKKSYPMSQSYKNINSEVPIQFLSQINQHKFVEEAPFQHPLQTFAPSEQVALVPKKQNTQGLKKTSFKKFIMNKELNPRLVTSTILNEKNSVNHALLPKDISKDQSVEKEKQNEQPILSNSSLEKSVKKNFKKMMMIKKGAAKDIVPQNKELKVIPLRKLENQRLLHGFFNDN